MKQLRLLLLKTFLIALTCVCPRTQTLEREWVKTHSTLQAKTNQAAAISIAPDGDVVVAGTSQNAEGNLDYQVVKYRPNGGEVWNARYGSANAGNDQLRSMTIDPNGNVFVTGTSHTVKYNAGGAFVWAVPLPSRAVIANADFVYVTGFSDTDIAIAQLENNDTDGRELWRRLIDGQAHGNDVSQTINFDDAGNVYIAGQEDYAGRMVFAAASYGPSGNQRWFSHFENAPPSTAVQANSLLVHPDGAVYVYGTLKSIFGEMGYLGKFTASGVKAWHNYLFGLAGNRIIVDKASQQIAGTGRKETTDTPITHVAMVEKFSSTGMNEQVWLYVGPNRRVTEGADIKQDSLGNLYVTGYSATDSSSRAIFLAKLTGEGRQIGLDRYNSPNAGSNVGTALAIDKNDNVYVTGYVQNTQGGSEFVTIKYSAAPKIEKKTNGAMHLEFHTLPGRQYSIEATTNFLNWDNLVTSNAGANGIVQYDDTNAPTIPYRFYRGTYFP
jgi:hypothetical protein